MNRQQRLAAASDRGVHYMVADVAKGMAEAVYEEMASVNAFYAANRSRGKFIAKFWRVFIQQARETLVDMLTDNGTSDFMKEKIMEGLALDGAMNPPIEHARSEAAKQARLGALH